MYKGSKSIFSLAAATFAGFAVIALLSVPSFYSANNNVFCSQLKIAVLNIKLPVSHPVNKCAHEQANAVSWSKWFAGSSTSYQFHFIDLLELLSRSKNTKAKIPTQLSHHQSVKN